MKVEVLGSNKKKSTDADFGFTSKKKNVLWWRRSGPGKKDSIFTGGCLASGHKTTGEI